MDKRFLREALFAGMTANAFKLGTVLTCGWFWPRVYGCSILYRAESMDAIGLGNILTVKETGAGQIGPPIYLSHNADSIYFYVVQRANICGDEGRTLSAAVKVSINAAGELAEPVPNNIFMASVEQVDGGKVQLVWIYCPLKQQSPPERFNVYCDGGTGQIDFENRISAVGYVGRRYYGYKSDSLSAGKYLFCVKAEDATSSESASSAQIVIQTNLTSPDTIVILSAEAL
jgi:hypothetical protein